jgi:hypothetical protein
MGEPHLHPTLNILTATTVAGVLLVAIAGCAGQPINAKESGALSGGVAGPGGGARAGVVVVTAGVDGRRAGVMGAGPRIHRWEQFVELREPQGSDQPL